MLRESKEVGVVEVSKTGHVEVRMDTIINRDGEEISRSHHRHVIAPGQDYSNEPAEVQEICKAVHTKKVIDAYKKALENEQ